MPDIIVNQNVKQFNDQEVTVEQKIIVDVEDNWVFIKHNGTTLSMALANFFELQSLSEEAIKKYKSLK